MGGRGSRFHAALDQRLWRRARQKALLTAGFRCEQCRRAGRHEVHHRTALKDGGDPYEQSNLQVLCRDCHIELHRNRRSKERQDWYDFMQEMAGRE